MAAPLSQLLAILDTALRAALGLGAWRILSPGPASTPVVGVMVHTTSLAAVQHEKFEQPTLLIADRISGEEEVPLVNLLPAPWLNNTGIVSMDSAMIPAHAPAPSRLCLAHSSLENCVQFSSALSSRSGSILQGCACSWMACRLIDGCMIVFRWACCLDEPNWLLRSRCHRHFRPDRQSARAPEVPWVYERWTGQHVSDHG